MSASISVDHVTKIYRLGNRLTNLRDLFKIRENSNSGGYHWAVKDVSFELKPGESLGIIGPNGAGKTTMLKLLSRVTQPTKGEIRVDGRLSALIELGAGFHPDITGRDNIFLNGTILGMRKSEISARFDDIVEFAGIGEYLDTPVKRYSSGMYARLGFAIAAHVDPQVLLVDEVLAVGDYAFQLKCYARMEELRKKGTTLIFVSHNMEAVRRVCERGLVMYRGEAIYKGSSAEAVVAYSDALRKAAKQAHFERGNLGEGGLSQRLMSFEAEIESVDLLDDQGCPVTVLKSGAKARIRVSAAVKSKIHDPIFSFVIRTPEGQTIYDTTTRWMNIKTPDFDAGDRCIVEYDWNVPLLSGEYEVGIDIADSEFTHFYDYMERALGFSVVGPEDAKGLVDLAPKIQIKKSHMPV